jgi:hypothetical protein
MTRKFRSDKGRYGSHHRSKQARAAKRRKIESSSVSAPPPSPSPPLSPSPLVAAALNPMNVEEAGHDDQQTIQQLLTHVAEKDAQLKAKDQRVGL